MRVRKSGDSSTHPIVEKATDLWFTFFFFLNSDHQDSQFNTFLTNLDFWLSLKKSEDPGLGI